MSVKKEKYYTYNELKELVISLQINSKEDYVSKYKTLINYGKKAPINPSSFYDKLTWESWSSFLNKPIYKKKLNGLYHSYYECKEIIKNKNIKSKTDYYNKINDLIIEDVGIPYNPRSVYKNKWEGWGIFLGTDRVQDNLRIYLPFEESRDWARNLNLKMGKEWRLLNMDFLPKGIPKKPEKTYKNKGWVDYYDWLGIDKTTKISYGEKIIHDFLTHKKIFFIYNKSLSDCKNLVKLRFDFYIPSKNICIEYDGIQHYKPIDFFGGESEFGKNKLRDKIKDQFCILNKIKLVRLPYFLKRDEIIELLEGLLY